MELLKRGGFHLTMWMSNSREVLATISEKERAKPNLNLDIEKLPFERALGVLWDVERDVFKFEVRKTDKPLTKRGILSTVSSLYDPMGFVCPVILEAKKIMQQLWKLQIGWDDPIPAEEQLHWERWKTELSTLSQVEIPRCHQHSNEEVVEISLHHFSDASAEDGYGMCSYPRFVLTNGTIQLVPGGKIQDHPSKTNCHPQIRASSCSIGSQNARNRHGRANVQDKQGHVLDGPAVHQK